MTTKTETKNVPLSVYALMHHNAREAMHAWITRAEGVPKPIVDLWHALSMFECLPSDPKFAGPDEIVEGFAFVEVGAKYVQDTTGADFSEGWGGQPL
jgi:hypothetical protein